MWPKWYKDGKQIFFRECQRLDRTEGQIGPHTHTEEGKERSECVLHQLPIHRVTIQFLSLTSAQEKKPDKSFSDYLVQKKSGRGVTSRWRLDWGVGERELRNLVRGVFLTKLLLPQTSGKNKCPNTKRINNGGVSIDAEPTYCDCACMFSKHYSYFSF